MRCTRGRARLPGQDEGRRATGRRARAYRDVFTACPRLVRAASCGLAGPVRLARPGRLCGLSARPERYGPSTRAGPARPRPACHPRGATVACSRSPPARRPRCPRDGPTGNTARRPCPSALRRCRAAIWSYGTLTAPGTCPSRNSSRRAHVEHEQVIGMLGLVLQQRGLAHGRDGNLRGGRAGSRCCRRHARRLGRGSRLRRIGSQAHAASSTASAAQAAAAVWHDARGGSGASCVVSSVAFLEKDVQLQGVAAPGAPGCVAAAPQCCGTFCSLDKS